MAKRTTATATSMGEKEVANNLLQHVQQAEEWAATKANAPSTAQDGKDTPTVTITARPAGIARPETSPDVPVELKKRVYAADGPISAVECAKKPESMLNVALAIGPVTFFGPDFAKGA